MNNRMIFIVILTCISCISISISTGTGIWFYFYNNSIYDVPIPIEKIFKIYKKLGGQGPVIKTTPTTTTPTTTTPTTTTPTK